MVSSHYMGIVRIKAGLFMIVLLKYNHPFVVVTYQCIFTTLTCLLVTGDTKSDILKSPQICLLSISLHILQLKSEF